LYRAFPLAITSPLVSPWLAALLERLASSAPAMAIKGKSASLLVPIIIQDWCRIHL
jgi:hypothetical protein